MKCPFFGLNVGYDLLSFVLVSPGLLQIVRVSFQMLVDCGEWCSRVRSFVVLNVFQEKRGGRAESDRAVRASVMGRVEGGGRGAVMVMVLPHPGSSRTSWCLLVPAVLVGLLLLSTQWEPTRSNKGGLLLFVLRVKVWSHREKSEGKTHSWILPILLHLLKGVGTAPWCKKHAKHAKRPLSWTTVFLPLNLSE